jgi:hypothetical protein
MLNSQLSIFNAKNENDVALSLHVTNRILKYGQQRKLLLHRQ